MSAARPARPALLRALNDRRVLELVMAHGPVSRTWIAEQTALSKPTVSEVFERLQRAGLVVSAGETSGRPGPNGQLFDLPRRWCAGAFSLRPMRIDAVLVDPHGATLARIGSPSRDLPRDPRAAIAQLSASLLAEAGAGEGVGGGLHGLVVGAAGSYDHRTDQLAHAEGLPRWREPGLRQRLAAVVVPDAAGSGVVVENDANLALLAELAARPALAEGVSCLLWLGSGLGLAMTQDGRLFRGASGSAGEIGYVPVSLPDQRGGGGRPRDFQDIAGGPAIAQLAQAHGRPGRSAADCARRAVDGLRGGNPADERFLAELAARIAPGLAIITALLDPAEIVLGGPIGRAGQEELATLTQRRMANHGPLATRISASAVTADPVLEGAAQLAVQNLRERVLSHVLEPDGPVGSRQPNE